MHQRVGRMDQVSHGFTRQACMAFFEADTLVFTQHWGPGFADHSVALTNDRRHMLDLVAAGFPGA
ncbi:hypothetical protein D3C85_1785940 [compost metagenome]